VGRRVKVEPRIARPREMGRAVVGESWSAASVSGASVIAGTAGTCVLASLSICIWAVLKESHLTEGQRDHVLLIGASGIMPYTAHFRPSQ